MQRSVRTAALAAVLALSGCATPYEAPALPQSFCFEMPGNPSDGNGAIYGQLDWTDGTMTAVKLTFTEGYIKGRVFQGAYDPVGKVATLEVSADTLFGTRAVAAGTNFTLDMGNATLATVVLYQHLGPAPFLVGTAGRCTIDFNEHYCALIDDGQFTIDFAAESGGKVSGTIVEYPSGPFTDTFTATVSTGGLKLSGHFDSNPGIGFDLDFTIRGMTGAVDFMGTPFAVAGARDPIGGGGCSNINLFRYRSSKANMYYNIPTIVDDSIYIGSSEGFKWKKTSSNYFVRLSAQTMRKMWYWDLGAAEVRGAAVLDPTGSYVYFVTEEGRVQDTSGSEPVGDHTNTKLYLYKLSNPTAGSPTFQWKREIAASRTTPDAYTIQSVGQYTPVVRANGDVFVGGEKLNGFDPSGTPLSGFPYSTPYCPSGTSKEVRSSPLIYTTSTSRDYVIFVSHCGMHALDLSTVSEQWYVAPGLGQYTGSPQFGKTSGINNSVYVALGLKLFCVNPENGQTCSGWPGSPWPLSCNVNGVAGEIRSSPIVDAAGSVYFGTKNDTNSKVYKMSPSGCATGTPDWVYNINNDVYPTGVLTEAGEYVVGNETHYTTDGNLNFYDVATGTITRSLRLHGDHSWGGTLRIYHNSGDGTNHLIGTADDGGEFIPGIVFSITIPHNYDTTAKNPTFRGSNANTGL